MFDGNDSTSPTTSFCKQPKCQHLRKKARHLLGLEASKPARPPTPYPSQTISHFIQVLAALLEARAVCLFAKARSMPHGCKSSVPWASHAKARFMIHEACRMATQPTTNGTSSTTVPSIEPQTIFEWRILKRKRGTTTTFSKAEHNTKEPNTEQYRYLSCRSFVDWQKYQTVTEKTTHDDPKPAKGKEEDDRTAVRPTVALASKRGEEVQEGVNTPLNVGRGRPLPSKVQWRRRPQAKWKEDDRCHPRRRGPRLQARGSGRTSTVERRVNTLSSPQITSYYYLVGYNL